MGNRENFNAEGIRRDAACLVNGCVCLGLLSKTERIQFNFIQFLLKSL